jgi:hypothetical protein
MRRKPHAINNLLPALALLLVDIQIVLCIDAYYILLCYAISYEEEESMVGPRSLRYLTY